MMKRIFLVTTILLLVFSLAIIIITIRTTPTTEPTYATVVKDNVQLPKHNFPNFSNIVFTDNVTDLFDTSPTVLTYSNDGSIVTISSSIFEEPPAIGDIIALPPDLHYPSGRAVRVINVDAIGDNVRLYLEKPELEEVFESIDFDIRFTPSAKEIVAFNNTRQAMGIGVDGFTSTVSTKGLSSNYASLYAPSSMMMLSASDDSATSVPYHERIRLQVGADNSISVIINGFTYPRTTSANVTNSVTIDGEVNLNFGEIRARVEGWNSWTDWISVNVEVPVVMTSTFNVKGQLGVEHQIPLKAIIIPDKLLPPNTAIEAGLFFVIGVDGSIEVRLGLEAHMSAGVRGSMPLTPLHPTFNVADSTPVVEFSAAVNGRAVVRLKAGIEILSLDLIDMGVEFGVGISGTLEPLLCPNVHITAHLVSSLNVELGTWDILGVTFLDASNSPRLDFYFDTTARRFNVGICPCDVFLERRDELIGDWVGIFYNSLGRNDVHVNVFWDGSECRAILTYFCITGHISSTQAYVLFNESTGEFEIRNTAWIDGARPGWFFANWYGTIDGDTFSGQWRRQGQAMSFYLTRGAELPQEQREELLGEWIGKWQGSVILDVRMVVERIDGKYWGIIEYDGSPGRALYTHDIEFNHLTGVFQSSGTTIEGGSWYARAYRIDGNVNGDIFTGRSLGGTYTLTRVR